MAESVESFLLIKMLELFEAHDFTPALGFALNHRHFRNRHSKNTERPINSIRFVDRNPDRDRGRYHTTDEECWIMGVELVLDMDLASEASASDPTGIGKLTIAGAECFKVLRPSEAGGLMQWCDDVLDEGIGPDEDSGPDEGRLVQSIIVLYRTKVGDPTRLLGPGENL